MKAVPFACLRPQQPGLLSEADEASEPGPRACPGYRPAHLR